MQILWTKLAIADLNAAYEFIVESNPTAAPELIQRVEKALETLRQFPEIGRVGRVKGTRELVIPQTPFIIPYRIQNNQIQLLAFMHSARQWPDHF